MEILKTLALQSPNAWGGAPILEVWLAVNPDRQSHAEELAAVARGVVGLARPYLAAEELRLPQPEAVPTDDLVLAGWLEALTRKLQSLCGVDLPVGRVLAFPDRRSCRIGIHFEDEGLARPALAIAQGLLTAAIDGTSYDFAIKLRELQSLANELCFGPSTRAIVDAARRRRIPVRRLNVDSLVQFGHGAGQRRICTAETDGTGAIAESIAQDKELTKSLLRRVGVPVPEGRAVSSADDAWEAAREIGVPVVVKPRDANHGRGVAIDLSLREKVMAAYECAESEGTGVLVEKFVLGTQHRVLVVGHRVVAASRAQPEQVVGDGVHSITQLVDLVNLDPRRGDEYALPMSFMRLGPIAELLLEQQGYSPSSVPAAGVVVMTQRNGEYTTDVTDHVHPEVAARAILATRVVGLDVAGIDFVTGDISRPLEEQGGMLIEVNAGPGLQMHSEPQMGQARPVGAAIIESLFPSGQTGRIPIVAVTSGAGATATAQAAAHLLRQSGLTVGLACAAGTFVGGRRLTANLRGPEPGQVELFLNPLVEAGVFEISASTVYCEGLGFDDCDVAVIAPAAPPQDAAAADGHPLDAWRQIVVENVSPQGTLVLAAGDADASRLRAFCRGSVLYYDVSPSHPILGPHRAAGGKAVFLRDAVIWAAVGQQEFQMAPWAAATLPHAPAVLAAVSAAWSAGVPIDAIGRGLESLEPVLAERLSEAGAAGPNDQPGACPDQPRAA